MSLALAALILLLAPRVVLPQRYSGSPTVRRLAIELPADGVDAIEGAEAGNELALVLMLPVAPAANLPHLARLASADGKPRHVAAFRLATPRRGPPRQA